MIKLIHGDCLKKMHDIPDKSIDMILCDLPYGVLNKKNKGAKWDSVIPFESLWQHYNRIIKDNGAIVLFGQGLFTARLMLSNERMWRYNLIWKKGNRTTGFLNANRQPMRNHEDIVVFSKKQTIYNPQMREGSPNHSKGYNTSKQINNCYGNFKVLDSKTSTEKYPLSVIDIEKEHPQIFHTSQKPVALLEWLIKTYTNKGDLVLDNCMGSGSTGVACLRTNRRFIGIELDEHYFQVAKDRINKINDNEITILEE